jgi:hypothetical protein
MTIINQELQNLIPALSESERACLEANLIADGCREPLVLWQGTLIDGHNRLEICTRLNIPFETTQMEFEDINAVKLWMIKNQNGRRNLSDWWRFQLALIEKQILLELGKNKISEAVTKANSDNPKKSKLDSTLSINDKLEKSIPHNTREAIAESLGWSTGKVAQADKVFKSATPEMKALLLAGEASINECYTAIKNGGVLVAKGNADIEWYTPKKYIESARLVLGYFDLDPASNPHAQQTIMAKNYHTVSDDGLTKPWSGKVWLNPPFTARVINKFIDKIVTHYLSGEIVEAIVLTNNASDTSWFQSAAKTAQAVCFTAHRISFYKGNGQNSNPTNGQSFFYFGENVDAFVNEFQKYGAVMSLRLGSG